MKEALDSSGIVKVLWFCTSEPLLSQVPASLPTDEVSDQL